MGKKNPDETHLMVRSCVFYYMMSIRTWSLISFDHEVILSASGESEFTW